jgi:hypothetical protein
MGKAGAVTPGRGGWFFTHLPWAGALRAGGQAGPLRAGQGCPAFPGKGMAARSPSPGQDTAQTTTRRSPLPHGHARPGKPGNRQVI